MQYSAWSGGSSLLSSSGKMYGCKRGLSVGDSSGISERRYIHWSCVPQDRTNLVTGKNAEAIDHLFGRVGVRGLAGHEVEERIEVHVTGVIWINNSQDALEVDVALPVLPNGVAQRHKAGLEFVRSQPPCSILVEVIETAAEFVELFLRDTLQ